jgi:acetyl coenzyme A synthetase (ADP forming)-like protein
MADYPAQYEFDAPLSDGTVVRFRPITPADTELERTFFQRVDPQSRYQRFFQAKRDLSPQELEYFTTVDYRDRMALIVLADDDMIGVGRYDVIDAKSNGDIRVAEVAFLVQDDYQGRGIGKLLLQHLSAYARAQDIDRFEAYVLPENHAMLRLFRDSGYRLSSTIDQGIYQVEFPTEYSDDARAIDWEREKRSVTASILPILYPRAVAVIGASRNEMSIGGRLIANVIGSGFTGPIYPVNPGADSIGGLPAYATIDEIPGPVDLAIIAVPAAHVPGVVEACGHKGVEGLVIISAGFSEIGPAGAEIEHEIVESARRHGMRMVGPNCMGVINTDYRVRLDAQFGPTFPPAGNVAMSSQSGALGLAILNKTQELGIGLSSFVSLGNRADVDATDLLLYWEEDPATEVIVLYVEAFGSPRRFGRLARRIGRTKPIVVVKAGRSAAGARAASSHTGSLASLDVAVDALFSESGVIRTNTLDELFDVTELLANQPLPLGRRAAVLSNAGGPAILAVDALSAQGIELPEFSDELSEQLRAGLADTAATRNPVDMIASAGPEQYAATIDTLMGSDEFDSLIIVYIPTTPEGGAAVAAAIHEAVARHQDQTDKTVMAVFMASQSEIAMLSSDDVRLPVYTYPESAARALAAACRYQEWRERPDGTFPTFDDLERETVAMLIADALRAGDGGPVWLDSEDVHRVLAAYGIASVGGSVAATADEAVLAASALPGSAVLKVIAESALHKSDVGGIALDVAGDDAVRAAFDGVMAVAPDATGVLVQEYVDGGHEVIIGMTEDPLFGPLIVFGLGGIFVELLKDVAFRIAPLTDQEAQDMVAAVKSSELLRGYRGQPRGDIPAVEDTLLRISALVENHPEIAEMDLNPVLVREPGDGVRVVDARIRVRAVELSVLPSRKDVPGRLA